MSVANILSSNRVKLILKISKAKQDRLSLRFSKAKLSVIGLQDYFISKTKIKKLFISKIKFESIFVFENVYSQINLLTNS